MKRAQPLVILCVLLIAISACGVPTDDNPRAIPAGRVPADLLATSTTASSTTVQTQNITIDIYMIRNDRLVAVKRSAIAPPTVGSALAALLQGPKATGEAGLTNEVTAHAGVLGAQVNGSVATVSVSDAFSVLPKSDATLALAQVVYTATGLPDVQSVQVMVNNVPIDAPRGDGTMTHEPLQRGDYARFAP